MTTDAQSVSRLRGLNLPGLVCRLILLRLFFLILPRWSSSSLLLRLLLLLLLLPLLLGLFGANARAALDADTPAPAARIGQLSLLEGNARMRIDRTSAWEAAVLNTPISTGAALATDGASRSEVRLGSTALRLAGDTQVAWKEISDNSLQLEIAGGMVHLRVRTFAPGERVLLGVGNVTLQPLMPGSYRIRHFASGTRAALWVQEGQARVALREQDQTLGPNQHVVVDRKTATLLSSGASDESKAFDDIVDRRDRLSEQSFSLLHVSAEMTGVEALDGHGSWRTEAVHGSAWYPDKLPVDWAPYRFGRWRWLAPWGWTWIDDAVWGFAPFHYGRWLFLGGRWAWVPGQAAAANAAARPVYAPALVGFFGNQAGAVWTPAGSTTPLVGWYPLAPGEVYWPAYKTSLTYVRALNASSVSEPAHIQTPPSAQTAGPQHRFARTAFAATAMPYAAFSSLQAVASHQIVLPPLALAQAPLSGTRSPPPRPALTTPAPGPTP